MTRCGFDNVDPYPMLMIKSGMATSLPDVVPLGIGVVWVVNGFGVVDVRRTQNFDRKRGERGRVASHFFLDKIFRF